MFKCCLFSFGGNSTSLHILDQVRFPLNEMKHVRRRQILLTAAKKKSRKPQCNNVQKAIKAAKDAMTAASVAKKKAMEAMTVALESQALANATASTLVEQYFTLDGPSPSTWSVGTLQKWTSAELEMIVADILKLKRQVKRHRHWLKEIRLWTASAHQHGQWVLYRHGHQQISR